MQVDLCARGYDISGVDSPQWHAVDLEGACDEEDTLGEVLEEDDSLAAESASQENEDGARLERCSWLCVVRCFASLIKYVVSNSMPG